VSSEFKLLRHSAGIPNWARRLLGLLAALGAVVSSAPAQSPVIDIIGDSVSQGVNPELSEDFGWVQLLLGEGGGMLPPPRTDTIFTLFPSAEVHNSAVSFATAADWASPETMMLQPVLDREPDLVVVFIGGNDFLQSILDGEFTADEQDAVRTHLTTIVDELQTLPATPEIILVDYYDLVDGLSENLPFPLDLFAGISDAVLTGNQIIHSVGSEKGCRVVSIYDDFLHHCYGREFGDTEALEPPYMLFPASEFDIHPVTAGHRAIADEVCEALNAIANPSPSGFVLR